MIRAAILHHRQTLLCIIVWYTAALLLTATNKTLLDVLDFPYPIFTTFVHFSGVGCLISLFKPAPSQKQLVGAAAPQLSFFRHLLPIALCTAGEVALTNKAYSMVSLSVLTSIKSTLVATTYITSIAFGLEKFSWKLSAVLCWIIGSVALSLPGMYMKDASGVILLALAVCCASFRWVLIQQEIQRNRFPILELIALTQPLAAICLVPAVVMFDGMNFVSAMLTSTGAAAAVALDWIFIVCGLLAVATLLVATLLYLEFKVIEDSSSLTLVVVGTGRECLTIAMSMLLFKESMGFKSIIGISASISGILYYAYLRTLAEQQRAVYDDVELTEHHHTTMKNSREDSTITSTTTTASFEV